MVAVPSARKAMLERGMLPWLGKPTVPRGFHVRPRTTSGHADDHHHRAAMCAAPHLFVNNAHHLAHGHEGDGRADEVQVEEEEEGGDLHRVARLQPRGVGLGDTSLQALHACGGAPPTVHATHQLVCIVSPVEIDCSSGGLGAAWGGRKHSVRCSSPHACRRRWQRPVCSTHLKLWDGNHLPGHQARVRGVVQVAGELDLRARGAVRARGQVGASAATWSAITCSRAPHARWHRGPTVGATTASHPADEGSEEDAHDEGALHVPARQGAQSGAPAARALSRGSPAHQASA